MMISSEGRPVLIVERDAGQEPEEDKSSCDFKLSDPLPSCRERAEIRKAELNQQDNLTAADPSDAQGNDICMPEVSSQLIRCGEGDGRKSPEDATHRE